MVRHDESCEGDWGQEGQESPCRCGDQHDRNREALAVIVKTTAQKFGGPSLAEFANDPPIRKHYAVADAILREFDVTPHIEDMGPAANCHLCVGAGGYEDHDGEWIECSCQRKSQEWIPDMPRGERIGYSEGSRLPEPQGEPSDALTARAKAQVIADAMEEVMAHPKRGAWLILRDIADAYRAESETMTVESDPSADEHRDVIGFLRENATELGIVEGWSTEDRREATGEALERWGGPSHDRLNQRDHDLYAMGARQGFVLGAEWWKAMHPIPEPDAGFATGDSDLIRWHVEQAEALRPFTRSSHHLKAAMMHVATVRVLRDRKNHD